MHCELCCALILEVWVQKKGKKTTSRRYNLLPLLRSRPGGLAGSWPCRTYPGAKVQLFLLLANFFPNSSPIRWEIKDISIEKGIQ